MPFAAKYSFKKSGGFPRPPIALCPQRLRGKYSPVERGRLWGCVIQHSPAVIQPAKGLPCAPLHAGAPRRLTAGSLRLSNRILAVEELWRLEVEVLWLNGFFFLRSTKFFMFQLYFLFRPQQSEVVFSERPDLCWSLSAIPLQDFGVVCNIPLHRSRFFEETLSSKITDHLVSSKTITDNNTTL